jgi:hypothetical protein
MMVKSSNLSQSPQLVINGKVATSLYTNLVRAAYKTSNNRKIAHQVYMYGLNGIKLLSYSIPPSQPKPTLEIMDVHLAVQPTVYD